MAPDRETQMRLEKVKTTWVGKNRTQMEPKRPFDPLHPAPVDPFPSPLRPPSQYVPRNNENLRIFKEILDRLTAIENRLKAIEEDLKGRR
jgi:hypothetical protein